MADKIYSVPPEERRTSSMLSIHECSNILATRSTQIEYGDSIVYVDYTGLDDSYHIALKELVNGKCPLLINRSYEYNDVKYVETWKVREMTPHPDVL